MRAAVFLLLATAVVAQEQTGMISGVVRDSVSQLPVKKAAVTLNPRDVHGPQQAVTPRSVITDSTGSFTISNLAAGKYVLIVQQENYPQRGSPQVSKKVEVKPGETGEKLTLELIPGAVVSGHVLDEDGDPLSGCFVQVISPTNPNQGVFARGFQSNNEDGEYRLSNIPAGKYILKAQCGVPVFQPRPFSSGPDPPPSLAYPPQYYPLAIEPKSAQTVELLPGSEKSRVDFRMKPVVVTHIDGTSSTTGADWHGRNNIQLQMMPADPSASRDLGTEENVDRDKGTFAFQKVLPGSYVLFASSIESQGAEIGAMQRVEVKDKPVEATIEFRPAIDISGKVELESDGANKVVMSQINAQLNPVFGLPGAYSVQAQDDGSFTFKSVLPGLYRLRMNAPNAFLKSARIGNDDVTDRPIDLSSGAAGTLTLVAGTNMAKIQGTAPPGDMVWLQELGDDEEVWSTRGGPADANGQFILDGIAPGKYLIVSSETGPFAPPEGGQKVTVHEGETLNVEVKGNGGS